MAWPLLASLCALAGVAVLACVVLALVVIVRLARRVSSLEAELASSRPAERSSTVENVPIGRVDEEYLITRVGELEAEPDAAAAGVVRVDATLFTDQLARESAMHLAALAHGVRRALSAESRNRIRFHVRQEVKRARKQRRAEMRVAHREWTARQRLAAADDPAA